ncbi:MAG: RNA polymerase sigma factor [Pseudonocardiaceae bacterium]
MRTTLVGDAADASAWPGGAGPPSALNGATARALDPPDDEVVRRICAGDQRSIAVLYDRYGRQAYSLARRICGDDGIAQDVVQEAFLAFWRNPQRFDPARGRFGTWLLTLVHHKSVDAVRRESALRRRTVPAAEDGDERSAPPGPGADQAAIGAVFASYVQDALGRLPEEQRRALVLSYYRGYTQREVAAITGVPLGTVKSRMFTGMQRLRALLAPLLVEPAVELFGPSR